MEDYLRKLYIQFCNAKGIEAEPYNEYLDREFLLWTKELLSGNEMYREYLRYLNVDLDPSFATEINKGRFDTLGEELVTIVSPYASSLNLEDTKLLIEDRTPYIITPRSGYEASSRIFLTQNPFDIEADAYTMVKLRDADRSICFGIYGTLEDEDLRKKQTCLEQVYSFMDDDAEYHFDTDRGCYVGCVITKEKTLRKVKTLYR